MGLFDSFVKREMLSAGWISKDNFSKLTSQEQASEIENFKKMKSLLETKGDKIKTLYGTDNIGLLRYKFNLAMSEVNSINASLPGKTSIDEYFLMRSYEQIVLKNEANRVKSNTGSDLDSDWNSITKRATEIRSLQQQKTLDTIAQIDLENKQREMAVKENLKTLNEKTDMFFDKVIEAKIDELKPYLDGLKIFSNANDALSKFESRFRDLYGDDWDKFAALLNSMELKDICAYIKFYEDEYACKKIENKYIYLTKDSSYSTGNKSFSGR